MPTVHTPLVSPRFAFDLQPGSAHETLVARASIPADTYAASTFIAALPDDVLARLPAKARPAPGTTEVTVTAPATTQLQVTLGPVARGLPEMQGAKPGLGARIGRGLAAMWGALVGLARALVRRPAHKLAPQPPAVDTDLRVQHATIVLSQPLEGRISSLPKWLGHQRIEGATVDARGKLTLKGGLRLFNVVPLPGLQSAWLPTRYRLKMPVLDMRVEGDEKIPGLWLNHDAATAKTEVTLPTTATGLAQDVRLEAPSYLVSVAPESLRVQVRQDVALGADGAHDATQLQFTLAHSLDANLMALPQASTDFSGSARVAVAKLDAAGDAEPLAALTITGRKRGTRQDWKVDYATSVTGSEALAQTGLQAMGGKDVAPGAAMATGLLQIAPSFHFTVKTGLTGADMRRRLPSSAERLAMAAAATPDLESGASSASSTPGVRTPAEGSTVDLTQVVA